MCGKQLNFICISTDYFEIYQYFSSCPVTGCLHDRAHVEQTSSWLIQAYWNPTPGLKWRPRLRLL